MRPIAGASTSTTQLTEEGRAFLQRRTARYGLMVGGLGFGFYLVRLALYVVLAGTIPLDDLFHPSLSAHLVGAVSMLALYVANARGARSVAWIRVSEALALGISCLGYGTMCFSMPTAYRPDLTVILIFGIALLGRAVYVPAGWRGTAGLGALLGVEVVWVTVRTVQMADPAFRTSLGVGVGAGIEIYTALLTNAVAWWIALSVLASAASAVIYGLRREADEVRRLGQYTLVRKLGEGGIGMVYEATHAMLRRPTAVKLLRPERVDEASLARFEREVRATAALHHPNTIRVFDYGRTPDGVFYYVMERVPGCTLTRAVSVVGPMPAERALLLLHQIAGALAEAHEAGLVHRDVKPDNVLLAPTPGFGDMVKVVDFGLVRELDSAAAGITHEGAIVGTPHYLAPEVIRGEATDARSDLYALGCLGFYLLTGEHVFGGTTVVEVCSKHLVEEPDAPSARRAEPLSQALDALIARCLAKDPAARYASAAELQLALEEVEGFGSWTREASRRWWKDFGPDLVDDLGLLEPPTTDTRTLAIDLGRRLRKRVDDRSPTP
ncbi:MAG: serine/threonine protein kinase [Sandaracinaceae bacterium]|nr:serine/threonine protein kinase [Sandaracinaceae bacterium]